MSITVLLEANPRRASDGVVQTLRMVWNARSRADFLGVQWLPVLQLPPSFETDIGFDGSSFGQGATPNVGALQIILNDVTASWPGLIWKNAALTIKAAPWPKTALPVDAADGDFAVLANCKAAALSAADGLLSLVIIDAGEVLRRVVQPVLFGNSGVALLDGADAKDHFGSPVPIGWGALSTVKGRLVDRTNLIYCFLGRAATAVGGFYDGGAAFTLGVARANLAALQANTPAAGAVDYCLNAAGLVLARPWAKPVYPFTADLTAGSTQAADIANSIVTSRTALTFGAGVVAAFNGIQGAPCGLYVDDGATIAEALDRLFAGLGSFWRLTRTGSLDLKRIGFAGAASVTFGSWQVARIERRATVLPTARRTLGYAHNNTVHGENDIAKLLTENLAYADGTAIDALKPAALGADVTAAQAIVSRLSSTTGQALDTFVLANGLNPASIVASGSNRDGDVITFAATLAAVPKITFLPGGNTGTAAQNILIQAIGLSASGFTLKARTQSVSVGSTITDGSATTGGGANPDKVINRTNAGHPYDNNFKYSFSVTVGNIAPGEPGTIDIAIYAKIGGSWTEVAAQTYGVTGSYLLTAAMTSVDYGAGDEFGISVTYADGSGTALSAFTNVKYTLGSVTDTSLTPSGASDIPWLAII